MLVSSLILLFYPPGYCIVSREVISSNYAELALVVLNGQPGQAPSPWARFWEARHHWSYQVFNALDQKLFVRGANACALVDGSATLANVPVLEVRPLGGDEHQHFSSADLERIKSYQLDILVKSGFGTLQGEILSAARYGLWAYRWGDPRLIEDGLTGFWEVVERWPETGVALQQLGVDESSHGTLFESWLFTYPFSPARSRNYILWAACSYLPRQLERLHRLGEEKFFKELPSQADKTCTSLRSNDIPSNLSVLWIALKLIWRNLVEVYRRFFFREKWGLLSSQGSNFEKDIHAYRKISPPQDRFWADPHVIYHKPNYYVFVEEYLYQKRRGHIAVLEIDAQDHCKPSIPVLEEDWHLSFPFVFDWRGSYYMIPESSEHGTIDLYECLRFPDQWQHKLTLMKDVVAVDTTVFHWNGKWWLLTGLAEQAAAAPQVELFLFHANELFTDQWQAHPMNPSGLGRKTSQRGGQSFRERRQIIQTLPGLLENLWVRI